VAGIFPSFRALARRLNPPSLGTGFGRLWSASAMTNLGDGAFLAAGPLLVASISTSPLAVGAAVTVQQVPWLLLALISGALVDRVDRRRLVVVVNIARSVILAALAALVAFNAASLAVVYAALFLLGVGETLADNAGSALVVGMLPREQLGVANARLSATFTIANQFVGPPLGAWLFAIAAAAPLGLHAAAFAGAALLLTTIVMPSGNGGDPDHGGSQILRHQIRDGIRWLWQHPGMRALTVCIAVMNLTFMAAFATWVLYAEQRLGLTPVQFGFLLTAGAFGGLAGAGVYARLERRFGRVLLVRAGLLVEAATHLVLAITTSVFVVFATMTLFGAHAVIWGTVATTVRQRNVPNPLLGRVTSVFMFASIGAAALGAAAGGLIARTHGLTAGFWIAALGVTALAVLIWRPLTGVDSEAAQPR
jgi:MFS family permease